MLKHYHLTISQNCKVFIKYDIKLTQFLGINKKLMFLCNNHYVRKHHFKYNISLVPMKWALLHFIAINLYLHHFNIALTNQNLDVLNNCKFVTWFYIAICYI